MKIRKIAESTIQLAVAGVFLACAALASAAGDSLLLNFRTTNNTLNGDVAAPYLLTDPAHVVGTLSSGQTTWNNLSSTASSSSLNYASGSAATGVTVTYGVESSAGSNTINIGTVTGINVTTLTGTGGGTAGQASLLGASSIYGNGTTNANTAPARAGWLNGTAGSALGMRLDGLAAGNYIIYVASRNTNGNAAATPMNIYASAGATSSTYNFSSLTATVQANTVYASPTTNYNSFQAGNNYVAIPVTITAGQSLYVASDGNSAAEMRGFLNLVQIVSVPEPGTTSTAVAVGLVLLVITKRLRSRKNA